MNFEDSSKLKSTSEIAKKSVAGEKSALEKKWTGKKLKSAEEIDMEGGPVKKKNEYAERVQEERAQIILAEAESKKQDLEKIKEIEKNLGLNLKDTENKIQEKIVDLEKENIGNAESADNYREITKDKIEAKDKRIREETIAENESEIKNEIKGENDIAASKEELPKQEENSFEAAQKEKARKADKAIADEFSKEETTTVHTDDSKMNEIHTDIKAEIKEKKPDNIIDFPQKKEKKMAAKNESGEYQGPASPAERAQVQKEALKDFSRDLRYRERAERIEKWEKENDKIMLGMEEFISGQKEKNSVTNAFKNMFSFIRKKGAEINSGKIAVEGAIEEFTKKGSEWAEKIFGERKGRKSDEALKIDEILNNDNKRSVDAIRVDESMDKAMEARMNEKLKSATSPDDLIRALDGMNKITGSDGKIHRAADQIKLLRRFSEGDTRVISSLAKGPIGENAQRILFQSIQGGAESAEQTNIEKSDFEKTLEKVTNPNDLMDLIDDIGEVDGRSADDQKQIIKLLFDNKDKGFLNFIPEKFGLKKNVERIYDLIQKNKEESEQAA